MLANEETKQDTRGHAEPNRGDEPLRLGETEAIRRIRSPTNGQGRARNKNCDDVTSDGEHPEQVRCGTVRSSVGGGEVDGETRNGGGRGAKRERNPEARLWREVGDGQRDEREAPDDRHDEHR